MTANRPRTQTSSLPLSILLAITIAMGAASAPAFAQDNAAKARALVDAAIKMSNSDEAVKLLWQATDIDPTFQDAYVYLGFYYNSRSDPGNVIKVYQKLIKYEPNQVSAYLNIAEAYMQYSPQRTDDALVWYRKAYAIDSKNSFAALRIGQILAQGSGNRDESIKFLRQALADSAKNPTISAEAEKTLRQIGAL